MLVCRAPGVGILRPLSRVDGPRAPKTVLLGRIERRRFIPVRSLLGKFAVRASFPDTGQNEHDERHYVDQR